MKIKTRFSPSPTGFLHIGSIRTALYSWLFAKHNQGKFVLRIEDTDFERSIESSVKDITNGLKWLGLDWDEGPYFQTKRLNRYCSIIAYMLEKKIAYKCYCSEKRLKDLKSYQLKNNQKPKYDNKCRELFKNNVENDSFVVRFKNPKVGKVIFNDEIRGDISFNNNELDDLIIQRSNGIPTYNFCVVIDDLDMKITHVIRGEDHINNTPRQINILYALNASVPKYAHVSMITGPNGKKLSKRSNVTNVMDYFFQGFLPEALLNYIVRLGWSHGNQEIFNKEEMIRYFNLKTISRSSSTFDIKKLLWLNHYYIKTLPEKRIVSMLKKQFFQKKIDIQNGPNIKEVLKLFRSRCNTLQDIVMKSRYFYEELEILDCPIIIKYLEKKHIPMLLLLYKKFNLILDWNIKCLFQMINEVSSELKLNFRIVSMSLRIIITGSNTSPSIDSVVYLIGKNRILLRIKNALNYIRLKENCKF